jgi:hypothetical protein
MKELGILFGSVITAAALTFFFLLVRRRRGTELPTYWLGFTSAVAWLPALAWSWLKPVLSKEPDLPLFDSLIAAVMLLTVLGLWSLLCSIPARMTGAVYHRLRNSRRCKH